MSRRRGRGIGRWIGRRATAGGFPLPEHEEGREQHHHREEGELRAPLKNTASRAPR
jgi:hypothetical protein